MCRLHAARAEKEKHAYLALRAAFCMGMLNMSLLGLHVFVQLCVLVGGQVPCQYHFLAGLVLL
jgi:hypothetical protein